MARQDPGLSVCLSVLPPFSLPPSHSLGHCEVPTVCPAMAHMDLVTAQPKHRGTLSSAPRWSSAPSPPSPRPRRVSSDSVPGRPSGARSPHLAGLRGHVPTWESTVMHRQCPVGHAPQHGYKRLGRSAWSFRWVCPAGEAPVRARRSCSCYPNQPPLSSEGSDTGTALQPTWR